MHIVNINNKDRLNEFVASQPHSSFLQSFQWGVFQESAGSEIFRIGVEDEGTLVAAATLIKKRLGFGRSYFYCPAGPVVKNFQFPISNFQLNPKSQNADTKQVLNEIIEGIYDIAKKENIIFLRLEPNFKIENYFKIENLKLKIIKTIDVQPPKSIMLDLSKSEDDLLKGMHQKTRYNIRLAEKKGVKISEGTKEDFEIFWKLMEETKDRDEFRVHDKDHYYKMLYSWHKDVADDASNNFQTNPEPGNQNLKLIIKLYLAEHGGRIIAGNIVAFYGDTVTYMHGASSNEFRNIMAPFALQWHCIKLAKGLGYKSYDLFGIDENKWPGVTRFKKGFGGNEIQYPGTIDMVINKLWYNIYVIMRYLNKCLRRFVR
jgi:peptidoglycan pentaglycine glycine transferase (the first glycine)